MTQVILCHKLRMVILGFAVLYCWQIPIFQHRLQALQNFKDKSSQTNKSNNAALPLWSSAIGLLQPPQRAHIFTSATVESTYRHTVWNSKISAAVSNSILHQGDNKYDRVSRFQHSRDWLYALPLTNIRLRLSDDTIRVPIGL